MDTHVHVYGVEGDADSTLSLCASLAQLDRPHYQTQYDEHDEYQTCPFEQKWLIHLP